MVPGAILQRTFHLKNGDSTGTCFTVDVDQKQYIITAQHVVENVDQTGFIDIRRNNSWNRLNVSLVGQGGGNVDVAVLAATQLLNTGPQLPLARTGDAYLSADIYFLGFPYNFFTEAGEANAHYPLPLVKKGIISGFFKEGNNRHLLLDGHNNPGFSGGPVVAKVPNSDQLHVIGIVSGYRTEQQQITHPGLMAPLSLQFNTGIVVSYSLRTALEIIRSSPIGLSI